MKLLKKAIGLICMCCALGVNAADQTLQEKLLAVQRAEIIDHSTLMIGMGLTQIQTDDYYIGALYLDENVQYDGSHEFLLMEVTRRMEFRIAANSDITARSFSRKLREGIRINNSRDDIKTESAALGRLLRVFKGSYKKGDVIQIDYHKNFGTRIRLNNRILGEVPNSKKMYDMLVNVWIGERPPSSKFKQGIVGNNENQYAIDLLTKFVSLK